MVDADKVETRLMRLEETIERLEEVREGGLDAYLADPKQRAMAERLLQVSIQICIDLGTQIATEQSVPAPSEYAEVFKALGEKEVISPELARRLGDAARQRNLLVHLYLDIDDRAVFASLENLNSLRDFAVAVRRIADDR